MYLGNLREYGTTTEASLASCGAEDLYSPDGYGYGYGDDTAQMACSAGRNASRGFIASPGSRH